MRINKIYPFNEPKTIFGTDRRYVMILMVIICPPNLVVRNWYFAGIVLAFFVLCIVLGRRRSEKDPWWFKAVGTYNRFADVYHPHLSTRISERFTRPFGFGRNIKM